MNRRILFILLPAFTLFLLFSCNRESTYTVRLHNISDGTVRVQVKLDPMFAAPGQNLNIMDKEMFQGQYLEIYYNRGVGISLPTKDDSLLRFIVLVSNEDSVYTTKNFRRLSIYSQVGNEKKRNFIYEAKIFPEDFPE
jgi:hypothetical protein